MLSTPRRGSLFARKASGSGFVEKIGITRIPDRAWTIALDYLDLGEVRMYTNAVTAGFSVEQQQRRLSRSMVYNGFAMSLFHGKQ